MSDGSGSNIFVAAMTLMVDLGFKGWNCFFSFFLWFKAFWVSWQWNYEWIGLELSLILS